MLGFYHGSSYTFAFRSQLVFDAPVCVLSRHHQWGLAMSLRSTVQQQFADSRQWQSACGIRNRTCNVTINDIAGFVQCGHVNWDNLSTGAGF